MLFLTCGDSAATGVANIIKRSSPCLENPFLFHSAVQTGFMKFKSAWLYLTGQQVVGRPGSEVVLHVLKIGEKASFEFVFLQVLLMVVQKV